MESDLHERSMPELLRDLSDQTVTLVRQEMQLLRVELAEKAKPVGASAVSFGGTALFGLGAFGAFTTFFIASIALVIPIWAAALIVALLYGVVAFVLVQRGKRALRVAESPIIPQTTQTIKDDIAWAKTPHKSAAK